MFNYGLNILTIIKAQLPLFLQTNWWKDWLQVLMKPLTVMHSEFLLLKSEYHKKVLFNGQKIYLQTILNDVFSPGTNDVYIEDAPQYQVYIYNASEVMPPVYLYNLWDNTYSYSVGEYCYYLGVVYECIVANSHTNPMMSTKWQATNLQPTYIFNDGEIAALPSFIVWVPSSLVFDQNKMKALIDYYRLAGRSYTIQLY